MTDLILDATGYFYHPSAIIDKGAQIGKDTRIWHWVHICSGAKIGRNCSLGQGVFVANKVEIGNDVKIQNNVSIYDDVTLEDEVFCGPSMVFTNIVNPRANIERKEEYRKTVVKKGASIGANATIVCGNSIGENSFVAAGAVVTKDVENFSLVAGVPATQIDWISSAGYQIKFDKFGKGECVETGEEFLLERNKVRKL